MATAATARGGVAWSARSLPEYTSDGGHLNPAGRRRAAAQFVRVLAATLRQPGGDAHAD